MGLLLPARNTLAHEPIQLMQRGGECLDQQRFLLGENRSQVKNQAVFFHTGDDRNSSGRAPQPLFQLRRGITHARNANHLAGQRLRGRRAASRQRSSIYNFDLYFVQRQLWPQLSEWRSARKLG